MLDLAFGVLALLSLLSGLAAPSVLASASGRSASGRSLKTLALSEAVLLAAWGICCLLPHTTFLGGPVSWGIVPTLFAIGGVFLVAFGGFAYLIGSFLIGLFSKIPQDDAATGQEGIHRSRWGG
jgi:hypothetical protein